MVLKVKVRRHIEIKNDGLELERVCQQILQEIASGGFSEEEVFAIHLALEEVLVNALKHGNKNDSNKKINIEYNITNDKFEITVTDQGDGFEPAHVPDPRNDENLCKTSGRGMLLIQSYMDKVEYNEKGNSVMLVKNRTK
jgi:serine/threonine-protein kinase RsbW